MQTIVFLETYKSGSSRDAIRAAEKLGYYIVVFTERKKNVVQRIEFPDIHELYYVQLDDLDVLKEKLNHLQKQGKVIRTIVSFIDSYVQTAALLSDRLPKNSLPAQSSSYETFLNMENKLYTRNILQKAPYNLKHAVYNHEDSLSRMMKDHELNFPIIIKLPDSTGSKNVLIAKNLSTLEKNISQLKEKSFNSPILIEEYIDGPQYLVETLVHNGKINIIAVIKQEIPKGKRFIITGYSLLAKVPEPLYESISSAVESIITSFGLKNGACHLELRFHNNQWKLIEINPRMSGGAMNKMIEVAYGINLAEKIIEVSLGKEPDLEKKHEKFVFTQYLTVSSSGKLKSITGVKRASRHKDVDIVFLKPKKGTYLSPPISMGQRYAFVIASSLYRDVAKKSAKEAASQIKFHLE